MERKQKRKFETPEIIFLYDFNAADIVCASSIELPPVAFDNFVETFSFGFRF